MRERCGQPRRRESDPRDRHTRGQLSLSLVEAAVGVLFVLSVATTFGLGLPDPGVREAQLDAYATDAATMLADEQPVGAGESRLVAASTSAAGFERERSALVRRLDTLLPATVRYRVQTPHGTVGDPVPAGQPVGRTTVVTRHGDVTIQVWYA